MDHQKLRQALESALGKSRFTKFVDDSNSGRLRWWQEREREKLMALHPEFTCSPEELAGALRICSLHGEPLMQGSVNVIDGCADYTVPYCKARKEKFPYAKSGPEYTQGAAPEQASVNIWYCSACRAVESDWNTRNGRTIIPLEWLEHAFDPETIDVEIIRQLESQGTPSELIHQKMIGENRAKWREAWDAFALKADPGDQFWTFRTTPWEFLSGIAGFAIVRNGQCIATYITMRS